MSEFVRQSNSMAEPEEPGFDFLGFLLRRSWLGVFFGTIGAAAAYYYYLQQPVRYKAASQILVIKQQADLPVSSVNGFDPAGQRDPLANDARMIKSEAIVGPAIVDGRLKELQSLSGSTNLVQTILSDLAVNRAVIQGDVLEITYSGSDPEDCAKVVNAIVTSYDKQLKVAYADVGTVTANLLISAKETWELTLKKSEDDYADFRKTATLLYNGESVTSVSQSRMAEIEAERSKVLIAQTDVKAQLDSIQKAIDRGGSREAILLMVEAFSVQSDNENNPRAVTSPTLLAAKELFTMELEKELLLEEVGPDHPRVKQIQKRIDLTRTFMQAQASTDGSPLPANEKPKDFLAIYIESLQQQLQAGDERLNQLNALFERETEASKKQTDLQIQDRRLQNEISRSQQVFNTINDRLKDVDLATKGGQYRTQVLQPATRGTQFEPSFNKTMGVGSMIGVLVGLLLGFLIESADKSFRSPDEISQTLHLPLVGISPQIQLGRKVKGSNIEPAVVTIHRPRSQSAEAFRGLRTHLLAASRGEGHKVVLITSPEPGDGKSTISGNLAVALAQSGKSVLLIDADMRRPTIHKLFALQRELGLSDLLDGTQRDIADCVKAVPIEGGLLNVMTAGLCPSDPGERLLSNRFENLMSVLRDKFEWIVIDSPPVLAVTDSATVSRLADGVLLVVRMNGRTRMSAVRAAESLRTLGANMIGVVANGIDPSRHGGYGYQYGVYGAGGRASKYYAESSDGR